MPSHAEQALNTELQKTVVLTVGHSTHPLQEFIRIVQAHGVSGIADIRTVPRSRHNPHFDAKTLPLSLGREGIEYRHFPELGGFRRSLPDSPNTGWRNASFRGFADYMQTPAFEGGMQELLALAKAGRWALMCAEALPWRCHRSLIADALLARAVRVIHIMGMNASHPHSMTPFAQVRGAAVYYPAAQEH